MVAYRILLFAVAIIGPLLIAWLIYRSDRWEPEARRPLLLCLLLGLGISIPALWLESWIIGQLTPVSGTLRVLLVSFVGIALVEETAKLGALLLYPYRQPFFSESMDGIVYAVMIAMGLAVVENVWYAAAYGWTTTLLRSVTAVPAHALFAIFQGYYAGRAHFEPGRERPLLLRALLLSILLHGLYNFLFNQQAFEWLLLLAAPLIGLTVWLARDLIRRHQEASAAQKKQ